MNNDFSNTKFEVPADANLLNTYGSVIPIVGTACGTDVVFSDENLKYVKNEYNAMTSENEMKPDFILRKWSPQIISVEEAKEKGYYIPDNYPEGVVPDLAFSTMDKIFKTCYENGLKLRVHTLVWHQQTPDWFFRTGYDKDGAYVDSSVMNKRIEYFIKTYLGHVCSSKYCEIVYACDVVNEFLHGQKSGYQVIYGEPNTKAQFIKDAFNYAYDTLLKYEKADKIKLFYNDFNTYMVTEDAIKLINFINDGRKVCAGIGMQTHLNTIFPSVPYYKATIEAFSKAGFEIQITELDVGCKDEDTQSQYYYDLMSAILEEKKAGANITALVLWGLSDDTSWRKAEKPLLYSDYTTKKKAYNAVLKAYYDVMNSSSSKFNSEYKLRIRDAKLCDAEAIAAICTNDLGYECSKELVYKKLSSIDKERECVMVTEYENKVIGFVHIEKYDTLYNETMANILGLAVSSDARMSGAGRLLMSGAENWAKAVRAAGVRLNSGSLRKEAHDFYRHIGYNNEKEQIRFIKML